MEIWSLRVNMNTEFSESAHKWTGLKYNTKKKREKADDTENREEHL